jgi:hypothetical protein
MTVARLSGCRADACNGDRVVTVDAVLLYGDVQGCCQWLFSVQSCNGSNGLKRVYVK